MKEKPMETEMWTVAFEEHEGDDACTVDIYLEPEWYNGTGPLCVSVSVVNSGCTFGLQELNPKSLHNALSKMLAYLDEMIDKRDVESDNDAISPDLLTGER